MATASETRALALTDAFKARQNREAAKLAALIALYYQQRVNVEDPRSVDAWLALVIPRLIRASDLGAREAAEFFGALRGIEVPGAAPFAPTPTLGVIDRGVRASLMAVGPGDFVNKMTRINQLDVSPQQTKALIREAKATTTSKVAGAVARHAQAGGRQTVFDNATRDRVALGYVRVTREKPCFFCAMLASRGIGYRPYKEGAFDLSDARFTGDGDAKVHDNCGCSLKPVYLKTDPVLARNETFVDMWSRWGAGGGSDAALRFRRGYQHWVETGDYLSEDDVAA